MKSINDNVINWVLGNNYVKFKKTKEYGEIEYNEITNNFKPKSRKQWTNRYGEELVRFLLRELDYGVKERKPIFTINGKKQKPDIETKEAIWEIKTRNWTTSGTAGEKILGTPLKYSEIPIIANKPLYIVLVAYQEYEAIHSFNLFKPDINSGNLPNLEGVLKHINSLNIHYIKCSDLMIKYLQKKIISDIKNNLKVIN